MVGREMIKIRSVEIIQFVLNHIVAHIPIWTIRRIMYVLAGMKIGKNSRILMGCVIFAPWKIIIGENSYVNEQVILDGRGGLIIGNNVSISMRSQIITGTHSVKSNNKK